MNNLERIALVYILSAVGILLSCAIGNIIYKRRKSKPLRKDGAK